MCRASCGRRGRHRPRVVWCSRTAGRRRAAGTVAVLRLPSVADGELRAPGRGRGRHRPRAFTDTSVLSRSYASRLRHDVDENQELIAVGALNVATRGLPRVPGLEQRVPNAGGGDGRGPDAADGRRGRGLDRDRVGGRTVADGGPPPPALAAIVIVAAIRLIEVRASSVARLAAPRRNEARDRGFLAVALSASSRAGDRRRGLAARLPVGRGGPTTRCSVACRWPEGLPRHVPPPEGRLVPGLLLFRFDVPLFFANADVFRDRLLAP